MFVLTEMRTRGVRDVFFIVCDGLKGLPDRVHAVFPQAIVQACVIHLILATFRYANRKCWDQLARDLRAISTAATAEAAWAAFEELERGSPLGRSGPRPPRPPPRCDAAAGRSPFRSWPTTSRSDELFFSTNAIESLRSRYRRAVTARGHFPTEQAALKTPHLVTRGLDPKGTDQARWGPRWKPALNAFAVTFADRMPPAETL